MGIMAHVDAGKTTLAEALLYNSGSIKSLGRVDHGDAYLDTDAMEKERGITIFSKQAIISLGDKELTLLDTPGHVDFSAEMERTLSVLDYAILLISAGDGIQGHTETLWRLLEKHKLPCIIFINKLDLPGADFSAVLNAVRTKLSINAVLFDGSREMLETIALCDEAVMEQYLENGDIPVSELSRLFSERRYFPVFCGSALKNTGIDELISGIEELCTEKKSLSCLSGRVYKISRGENGQRLSHIRLSGGVLSNREELCPGEKVTQIRIYNGGRYSAVEQAFPGQVVAVQGIGSLRAGDVFGEEEPTPDGMLRPVLDYRVLPAENEAIDEQKLYRLLMELYDEMPELNIRFDEEHRETHVLLMGEVQTEILTRIVKERFGACIGFDSGAILYRESINNTVEGIGHFEPLRHYAEVHVLLEPLPRNSGMEFSSDCPTELLPRNWQRLVLKHLMEKEHRGVLIGAPITDMRLTLIAGKAHLKHTEGGDFREASCRAVRQGLRKAESILLEPYYSFRMELPTEHVGRAMTDIQNRSGSVNPPESSGELTVLSGTAPVSALRDYAKELVVYTRGKGRIYLEFWGYESCHNAQEIIFNSHYDPEADILNPSSSVFCAHGSGFLVPYDEVERYAQVQSEYGELRERSERVSFRDEMAEAYVDKAKDKEDYRESGYYIGDRELENIFVRTYGAIKNRAAEVSVSDARTVRAREREENIRRAQDERRARELRSSGRRAEREDYLLVDGYNIIFAWQELRELAEKNLDSARGVLLDILSDYQGYMGMELIAVFDAYRVQGHPVESFKHHNIHVVFTAAAQTADRYIEELSRKLSKKERGIVSIATGDKVVQVIVWSNENVQILSANDLLEEVNRVKRLVRNEHLSKSSVPRERLGANIIIPEGMKYRAEDSKE